MKILFASGNSHKKDELNKILKNHELILPKDLGIEMDVEESGETYLDNALLKAKALYKLSGGIPVLSDDSGISVEALNGKPGVHSARYGTIQFGRELSAKEKNDYLLSNLLGINNRNASFVCCMVLILDENRVFSVQERLNGVISESPCGSDGFGYDPIFYLPEFGKSVAELSQEDKNRVSHRGKAGKTMNEIIKLYD